ncbi:hypothetical protein HGRIS_002479 [Hohenbuehelia grisea]|uniref:Uncharacterized protein n=1 Tax=Hohenbuehelia grisea TaxID=104357 RepID=A0ABR3JLU1_9AGAR
MAHTTTATSTHQLTKYSKNYPLLDGKAQTEAGSSEWQHFVNPILRLVLDTKKSVATQELESVRVRIVWTMETGMNVQNEIVLEDLDLLAFSAFPLLGAHQRQGPQSLPLKAVYKDAMVGIRYLHPITPGPHLPSVFRRFQITFSSATSASEFINSIQHVCPCKENPPTPNPVTTRQLPQIDPAHPSTLQTSQYVQPMPPMALPAQPQPNSTHCSSQHAYNNLPRTQSMHPSGSYQPMQPPPTSQELQPYMAGQYATQNAAQPGPSSSNLSRRSTMAGFEPPALVSHYEGVHTHEYSSSQGLALSSSGAHGYSSSPMQVDTSNSQPQQVPRASVPWQNSPAHSQVLPGQAMDVDVPTSSNVAILPGSTPPSSSANSDRGGAMLPPPVPSQHNGSHSSMPSSSVPAFVAHVRDTTKLNDLQTSELEALVSKVVCEPGFAHLVGAVSQWYQLYI